MTQPLLGIAASAFVLAISLAFLALFDLPTFLGWVSFVMLCVVPPQIVMAVIATRGGGPEDFVIDGGNGWLVPQGDPAALATRLMRCLEPAEWQRLRLEPDHLLKFSMTESLAPRWAGIYSAL